MTVGGVAHVGEDSAPLIFLIAGEASGDARTARVKLQNKHGLHARPAHLFVQTATAYASQLRVTRVGGDEQVVELEALHLRLLHRRAPARLRQVLDRRRDLPGPRSVVSHDRRVALAARQALLHVLVEIGVRGLVPRRLVELHDLAELGVPPVLLLVRGLAGGCSHSSLRDVRSVDATTHLPLWLAIVDRIDLLGVIDRLASVETRLLLHGSRLLLVILLLVASFPGGCSHGSL